MLNYLGNLLNDLWKFDGTYWTWISGSDDVNQKSVGQLGISAENNGPGGRRASATWIDSSNSLYLFGGYGYSSSDSPGNSIHFKIC